MSKGYVYILSNPAMPGIVKVGRTSGDPECRAVQLQSTGVPLPFNVEFSVLSPDCISLEALAHEVMSESRVNGSREFFYLSPSDASKLINDLHKEQMSCWISEFAEGMMLVDEMEYVDPSCLHIIGNIIGRDYYEVPSILGEAMLYDDEFDMNVLCQRHDEHIAKMKERRAKPYDAVDNGGENH